MGLKELLKVREAEDGYDKKKPNKALIIAIILAVFVLAFSSFFDSGGNEEKTTAETDASVSEFAREEERRLEMILKRINGAGDVSVYISVESGGEKILARDNKSNMSEESSGEESSKSQESESLVVRDEEEGNPYVVEETTPQVAGVLVVAKGASSEKVRLEIYDAVKALYGIAAHRIKISY